MKEWPGRAIRAALLFLLLTGTALAGRVALLPLADLSQGVNSVNLPLTMVLFHELEKRGFEMISEDEVLSFMARHRIRWTGYLDGFDVLEMNREIDADLVLLGTVTQWGGAGDSVGVVLYLVKADGGRLVWSKASAYSRQDVRHLLGLGDAKSIDDLVPRVLDDLLATLPNGVRRFAGAVPLCDVEGALIVPRYAKGGDEVTCSVKLRCMGEDPTVAYLKFGSGGSVPMERVGSRYVAKWKAPMEDGRYPVSLVLEWNHGSGRRREFFLSSYWVDSHPPRFALELKKGIPLGDRVVFRHHIVMLPRFSDPEPLSRWSIQILDEKGNAVVDEHGEGSLPRVLVWRGQTSGGSRLREGDFTVVLKVWDRAGNMASSSREVLLRRTPPRVTMEALREGDKVEIKVDGGNGDIPLSYWRLVVRDKQGELLKEVEGERLPASLEIPANGDKEVVCTLEARDLLGNRVRMVNRTLKVVTLREKREQKGKWVEEF